MKKLGAKLAEIARKKLLWSVVVLVITQIQGYLPTLDWLPQNVLKPTCFILAVLLTAMKGVEMFYEKSEQLFKSGEISFDTETLVNPNPPKEP